MLELTRYDIRILIDAGLRLRSSGIFPDLTQIPKPNLIIVSHAHLDHCGALPKVNALWPDVEIWCQNIALPLIEYNLELLCVQSLREASFGAPEMKLYTPGEIDGIPLRGKDPEVPYRIPGSDLTLTFWHAGHTVGASSISIEGPEDSFFFTGEYATHDEPTVPKAKWPERRFDVVVASCSGVAGRSYDREAMHRILVQKVGEILSLGGWAVFPLAESGKAQDAFLLLERAQARGEIPAAPLYWDGAQRHLAMVFSLASQAQGEGAAINYLDDPGVAIDESSRISLPQSPGILFVNPGFLISSQGEELLDRILSREGSAVFMPVRPDTPLDLRTILSESDRERFVVSYQWPTHPSEDEMAEQLLTLQPQAILLVHGTQEMQRNLRASLPAAIIRRSINSGETLRVRPQGL